MDRGPAPNGIGHLMILLNDESLTVHSFNDMIANNMRSKCLEKSLIDHQYPTWKNG